MQEVGTSSGSPAGRPRALWVVAVPLGVFGAVIGFLAYMLLLDDRDPGYIPSALVGQPAPSVAGASLIPGAAPVGDDVFGHGEPVLVNFFASWCGPCQVEHPVLTALAEEHGLTVIGINYKDDPAAGLGFLGDYGNPYAQVAVDPNGSISVNWGVTGLPETFIVDGDGTVVYRHFGPVLPAQREAFLAEVEGAS
ncbi:MAG: DsbE family thiol:disulfide interchange protein [Alphaproteobacteria bacterium]